MKQIQKKLTTLISKIKVQRQLYLIFFAAVFIPVTFIGGYLVYNTRNLLKSHYEEQAYSDNLRVKSILLDLTTSIYHRSEDICKDTALSSILNTTYENQKNARAALEQYKAFDNTMKQDTSIDSMTVYTFNTSLPEYKFLRHADSDVQNTFWFQEISRDSSPFWCSLSKTDDFGNPQTVLALYCKIFLPESKSFAVLEITASRNHLRNRLENNTHKIAIWINEAPICYASTPDFQNTKNLLGDSGKQTYAGIIHLNGKNAFLCRSNLHPFYCDDMFHISTLNFEGYAYIQKVTFFNLLILLLILLVTTGFIYLFSSYFGKRVSTLRHAMHEASRGNYHIADTFNGSDELSDAFSDLNIMVQTILKKEEDIYSSRLRTQELINKQQQMEFKMLSSQINPHFLYNTLETIRMRSLKAGNREVANAVKLLGKSMHYVLENTVTASTTLEKELDYISTYLSIQKLRFHDRVNYHLKYSEFMNLGDYHILPLLLQPIVENAILHGLEEVDKNGWIIIHILQKGQELFIKIFDNGSGMTPAETKQMIHNMHHHPSESSKSIGLFNIYQRIRLCYGSEYDVLVKSKKDVGTLFILTIPVN